MANIKDDYVFKLKGGEASALEYVNPFLERREPIVVFFEDGRTNIKIGDGKNNYNSLPFISDTSIDINDIQGLAEILHQYEIDLENLNDKIDKIVIDKVYDPNSDNAQSGKAVAEALETTVGRKTPEGGEIFNDYENNKAYGINSTATGSGCVAGALGYHIIDLKKNLTDAIFEVEDANLEKKARDCYEVEDKIVLELKYHFPEMYKISELGVNEETGNSLITVVPVSGQYVGVPIEDYGARYNTDLDNVGLMMTRSADLKTITMNGATVLGMYYRYATEQGFTSGKKYSYLITMNKPLTSGYIVVEVDYNDGDMISRTFEVLLTPESELETVWSFTIPDGCASSGEIRIATSDNTVFEDQQITIQKLGVALHKEGFELVEDEEGEERFSNWIWNAAKPDCGEVFQQCEGVYAGGIDSMSGIRGAFASGVRVRALGGYSTALGRDLTTGYCSIAAGKQISNLGEYNACFGYNHTNNSKTTFMTGTLNKALDYYTYDGFLAGRANELKHPVASLMGLGLISSRGAAGQVVVGRYNSVDEVSHSEYAFCVGNGKDANNRGNAFVVYDTVTLLGNADIPVSLPTSVSDRAVTSKKYVDKLCNTKFTELQTYTDSKFNSAKTYTDNAINERFVVSNGGLILNGATGKETAGMSIAINDRTKARGQATFAAGCLSEANGYRSAALGVATIANGYGQFVIGQYNNPEPFDMPIGNGDNGGPLFIIGNGNSSERKNAFVVHRDGYAEVQKMGTTDNSVATKGYVDAKVSNSKSEMILTDKTTNKDYKIYVKDGKLQLEEM